jgi:Zn-finger nucleic acid-binding protein
VSQCPKCKSVLGPLNLEADLHLERCKACKGLWLDKGELARSTNSSEDLPDLEASLKESKELPFNCPKCANKLQRMPFFRAVSTLMIDRCPSCQGLWLDALELGQVQGILQDLRIQRKKSMVDPR